MLAGVGPASRPGAGLLAGSDPAPVEVVNAGGSSPYVLTCEHAGRLIPEMLGDLGLAARHLERHIAWDIGAEGLARGMADALDAPLVVQRYSRLVIDCNRPLTVDDSIPEVSDGTAVPANAGIDRAARDTRGREIHAPYHETISTLLDGRAREKKPTALVAVHSFTPSLEARPAPRPWDIGLLHNRLPALSRHVHDVLALEAAHLEFTFNEPYCVTDLEDYTIPVHGEGRGLPSTLFEVRNDHIADAAGQGAWAELLARVLRAAASRL